MTKADKKIKASKDKVPLSLIPLRALYGVARVFAYGARKYAPGDYYTADDAEIPNRYMGAALRHLAACQRSDGLSCWWSVSNRDKESGLPELDHAISSLIMLRALASKHCALPEDPGPGWGP